MYFRDLVGKSPKRESGGVENEGLVSLVLLGDSVGNKRLQNCLDGHNEEEFRGPHPPPGR